MMQNARASPEMIDLILVQEVWKRLLVMDWFSVTVCSVRPYEGLFKRRISKLENKECPRRGAVNVSSGILGKDQGVLRLKSRAALPGPPLPLFFR